MRFLVCQALLLLLMSPGLGWAQRGAVPADIPELETSGRIALQQIDQLIGAQSWDAAVDEILRLADTSGDRLIQIDLDPKTTESLERWVPVRDYLNDRLVRWGLAAPEVLSRYRQRIDSLAAAAVEAAAMQKDLSQADSAVREFLASSYGDAALRLQADLAIDRGWAQRGRDALVRIDSRLQATGVGENPVAMVPAVAWSPLLVRYPKSVAAIAEQVSRDDRGLSFGSYRGTALPLPELAARLPYCSVLQGDIPRAERELELVGTMFESFADSPAEQTLRRAIAMAKEESTAPDAAVRFAEFPIWTTPLHRIDRDPTLDSVSGSSGAAGSRRSSYFPAVWNGRVFVHDVNRIVGFDLRTGAGWPIEDSNAAVFDTGQPPEEILPPAALPASGWPRFTLNVVGDRMVARLGPAVTGWLPVMRKPPGSASSVAVFDLDGEGRLLDAYPKSLDADELGDYEIEAPPMLVGDRIFCGITRRAGSLYTSRVLCIDLRSGQRLWISPELAVGPMPNQPPANRVSHATVAYREGMLFYHANLGTVSAIDAQTGKIRWLVRYERGSANDNPYRDEPFVDDRDLSPVLLDAELAIVAAADCDRVFALDSATGQTLWTSGPELAEDVECLLGTTATHVIASGDRLYWIDKFTGRVDAVFAGGSTSLAAGGSSQPRTAGRGAIAGNRIFWPTDDAILVFDAVLADTDTRLAVRMVDRIDLLPSDLRGGNLLIRDGYLILASPDRLAVFDSREFKVATIAPGSPIGETLKHE
ncbi:PQQ-binding-like beta-propeller repeat protein [Rosistilla oblonga]|uniref:outer membrane protein assembly factor BamB family protein n=1 Tax=Rosistilla oblonga TaxID=2527990 RepID=UPI003A984941